MTGGNSFSLQGDRLLVSSILADPRPRRLLSVLREHSEPMTERDLVVQLAAREAEAPPSEVTERERRSTRIALHHSAFPRLEEAGWIDRSADERVSLRERSVDDLAKLVREDAGLDVPSLRDPDHPSWEAIAAIVARPRRRHVVWALLERRRLTLEQIASEVEASDGAASRTADGDQLGVRARLHHVDLPKLDDVGLVTYDPGERTVTRDPFLETVVDRSSVGPGG